jgi:hypothetical protein
MIVLLDTAGTKLDLAQYQLGLPVEQLFTPLTRFSNQHPDRHFAIDNGAFSHFDRAAFESLLELLVQAALLSWRRAGGDCRR